MSVTLVVVLVGLVVIGLFGVLGRRRQRELSDWTVGGRRLGGATMWFLQAGEIFTIFTFLGLAGLGCTGGVAAMYALLYIPLAFAGLYFLGPRLWRRCKEEGHLTQADFIAGHFGSPLLGRVVAVLGVVFVLPYLQLQITGLGLAVQLATGDRASADVGMVIAFVITVGFVVWSGIRGVATASYLKDGLLLVVLVVLAVVIPSHFTGGLGHLFSRLVASHPAALTIHSGPNDAGWYATSVVASGLGILCMTLPHLWPELLAARSERALRRNYVFLPAYCLVLVFPVFVGMTAIGVLPTGSDSNSTLLRLVSGSLPPWLVGLVVVAAAATAMVPAGGIIIGMSTLVSRNIARTTTPRSQFRVTLGAVIVVAGLALLLALLRPDLIANLLLLTYSGLDQLIPAILLALYGRRIVGWRPVLAGMLVGVGVVIALTPPFGGLHAGHLNAGLLALVPNLLVVAVGAAIERRCRADSPSTDVPAERVAVHR